MTKSDAENRLNAIGIVNAVFNLAAVICIIVYATAIPSNGAWLIAMLFVFIGTELLFLLPYPSLALPGRGLYAGGVLGLRTAKKFYENGWYGENASFRQIARLEKAMKNPDAKYTLPIVETALGGIFFISGFSMMVLNYDADISSVILWLIPFVVLTVLFVAEGIFGNLYSVYIIQKTFD